MPTTTRRPAVTAATHDLDAAVQRRRSGDQRSGPTYDDVLREVTSDIYNGTRNLYSVDVTPLAC